MPGMFNVGLPQTALVGGIDSATPTSAEAIVIPTGATGIIIWSRDGDASLTLGEGETPTASSGVPIIGDAAPVDLFVPVNAELNVFSAAGTVQWYFYKA